MMTKKVKAVWMRASLGKIIWALFEIDCVDLGGLTCYQHHSMRWLLLLGLTTVYAHSQSPEPLHPSALSHPNQPILTSTHSGLPLLPNQIGWNDSFLLHFKSHNTPITLALEPVTTLFHPQGIQSTQVHTNQLGIKTTTHSILHPHHARVYQGSIINHQSQQPNNNWARIILLPSTTDAPNEPHFQGSYSLSNELYTIYTTPHYQRIKHPLDPDVPLLIKRSFHRTEYSHPSMVVTMDSHTLSPREQYEALRKRGLSALPNWPEGKSCGHDQLDWNSNAMPGMEQVGLQRRQGDIGGGSNISSNCRFISFRSFVR